MLNIGLIGKIANIEKEIQNLNKYSDIRILGKSSVGTKNQDTNYKYSVPEYNKIELLERADVIFLEDTNLLPYELIKDSIKRDKHFFLTEYPKFSLQQLNELSKLIDEASIVFQVKNPFINLSSIQWLSKNISFPLFIEINKKIKETNIQQDDLYDIFMLIFILIKREVKRLKNVNFNDNNGLFHFHNLRLEFDDSSIINLNIFSSDNEEFRLRIINNRNIYQLNIYKNYIEDLSGNISLKGFKIIDEYESFFHSVRDKKTSASNINIFNSTVKLSQELEILLEN